MPDLASYSEDVIIISGGGEMGVGGTSCAAPVVAGILSLVNDVLLSKGRKTLGFFNPLLYKMITAHPNAVFGKLFFAFLNSCACS
jgi:tripeptidyl-peptidase-1